MIIEQNKDKTMKITLCKDELYVFAALLDMVRLEDTPQWISKSEVREMLHLLTAMTSFTLNAKGEKDGI